METSDRWVETEGGRLFSRLWHPGAEGAEARAAILLMHDSLGCVALWREFPARLAEATGRRVVAYDRMGFGLSDPHPGRLATGFVEAEARMGVRALCDALGLSALVPFGHSVGGGMAVSTAAEAPVPCEAVVTVATQAFVEDRTLAGIREAQHGFRDPAQMERLARYHGAKAPWVLDAWTGTWLSPAFAGWTLDAALARVPCPVLALHGDRDEYGSRAHPDRIAAGVPGAAEVVILEECGHVPHRERPDAVLAAVSRFLAVPGGAQGGTARP